MLLSAAAFLVTKPELTGTKLGDLQLRRLHGINVTRVNRAGVELVATQGFAIAGWRPCNRSW